MYIVIFSVSSLKKYTGNHMVASCTKGWPVMDKHLDQRNISIVQVISSTFFVVQLTVISIHNHAHTPVV